ncbi:MAG: branched-chain amino acid ABC transporter permease [Candidatus Bathyarchaeia archaeon]
MLPFFLDLLIGGFTLGAIYALISAGLNMQFGVTSILNVAHGEFLMLGAYVTYFLFVSFGVDPLISLVITGPLFFFLGTIVERVVLRRLFIRISTEEAVALSLLACFGLQFIFQNVGLILFGATEKGYLYATQMLDIGGANFPLNRIIVCVVSLIINLAIYVFLRFTQAGRAIRATAKEPIGAQLVGIRVFKVRMYAFGLGAMLSAWTGTLISMLYALTPFIGGSYTIIALTVIVLGGLGNFIGSIIGGIILGYVSYVTMRVAASSLVIVLFYAIFILILLVMPTGLSRRRRS